MPDPTQRSLQHPRGSETDERDIGKPYLKITEAMTVDGSSHKPGENMVSHAVDHHRHKSQKKNVDMNPCQGKSSVGHSDHEQAENGTNR